MSYKISDEQYLLPQNTINYLRPNFHIVPAVVFEK